MASVTTDTALHLARMTKVQTSNMGCAAHIVAGAPGQGHFVLRQRRANLFKEGNVGRQLIDNRPIRLDRQFT
jgi:hypothetical protein